MELIIFASLYQLKKDLFSTSIFIEELSIYMAR